MNRKRILTGVVVALACSLPLTKTEAGEVSHPRVMFGRKDIPRLKEKIKKEPWASWYKDTSARAEKCLEIETEKITGYDARWRSVDLAFVYAIEGDKKYALKCRDILLAMPAEKIHSRATNAIHRSYSGMSYPLAYDMIHDALTGEERKRIDELMRTALISMVSLAKRQYNGNIRSCYADALGVMGLAMNEKTWVDQARTAMEGVLDNCVKGEGAFNEGQSYGSMGIGQIIQLMVALRRIPGEKDYFQHPRMRKFLDFCVLSASPLGTAPCFEDSSYGNGGVASMYYSCGQFPVPEHAKAYNWLINRYKAFGGRVRVGGNPFSIITMDRVETEVEEPWEVSGVYPGAGMAFLRSGWDTEALYLAITCKTYNSGPHRHFDENSIELWAYGAYLLANPGYPGWGHKKRPWCSRTEASNTILIDGAGQRRHQAEGFGKSLLTDFLDYTKARGSRLYGNGGFNRNVLFIRPTAEAPGYYILIDRIKTAKADAAIDWLLHGRGSMKVGPQTASWTVESFVTKKPVTLTARIVTPTVKITRKMGYNAMDEKDVPCIEARHTGPATYVAVLYPTKEGQKVPEIKKLDGLDAASIGSNDMVFSQVGNKKTTFGKVETDASICFVRKEASEYFFVAECRYLKFQNDTILESSNPVTAALQRTSDSIQGAIDAARETSVSLATPPVKSVKVNRKEVPIVHRKGILELTLKGKSTISISY